MSESSEGRCDAVRLDSQFARSSSTFLRGFLTCLILILTRSPSAGTHVRPDDFMGPGMIARDPCRQSTIYCLAVNTSAIDVITGWCYHYQRRCQLHWLTLEGPHSNILLRSVNCSGEGLWRQDSLIRCSDKGCHCQQMIIPNNLLVCLFSAVTKVEKQPSRLHGSV